MSEDMSIQGNDKISGAGSSKSGGINYHSYKEELSAIRENALKKFKSGSIFNSVYNVDALKHMNQFSSSAYQG